MHWYGGGLITIINYSATAEVGPSNAFLLLEGPPFLLLDGTNFLLLEA